MLIQGLINTRLKLATNKEICLKTKKIYKSKMYIQHIESFKDFYNTKLTFDTLLWK